MNEYTYPEPMLALSPCPGKQYNAQVEGVVQKANSISLMLNPRAIKPY